MTAANGTGAEFVPMPAGLGQALANPVARSEWAIVAQTLPVARLVPAWLAAPASGGGNG